MWIQPLREQDIIPASRREIFINKVFCNIMAIHQVNHRFLSALRVLQEENPIVAQIGDVVLDFVMQLEPFLLYGARQHEAKYMLDQERVNNKKFAVFAEVRERIELSPMHCMFTQLLCTSRKQSVIHRRTGLNWMVT